MKKLTYQEAADLLYKHNDDNNVDGQFQDKNPIYGVAVFKGDKPIEERSFRFRSDNKRFISSAIGTSVFAERLDGKQECRIEQAICSEALDYIYLETA